MQMVTPNKVILMSQQLDLKIVPVLIIRRAQS